MKSGKRHFYKAKARKRKSGQKRRFPKIKPGADPNVKKVFASIGVPDKTSFKPDPFQLEALSVTKHSDCLVTAPTGAGKTWIAQQAIDRIHKNGGRSWYASPLKALSNTKFGEFSEIFGEKNVGILTGDRKENPSAPIIVGTTEILRNQLYDAMHQGITLPADFVVLDEAHFLGDEDRGVVWEEIIIYLPPRIPLLLLSATIGNAGLIAEWMSAIRSKECMVVIEKKRPVPLYPLFFHPSGKLHFLLTQGDSQKSRLHKKVADYLNTHRPLLLSPPYQLPPFGEIMRVLNKFHLLPAIFFLKSRADCDHALDLCKDNPVYDQNRKFLRRKQIQELMAQDPHMAKHRQLWHLEHLAVGAHHSGQLPSWKLILETLMTQGLLDAVFATSTVAAGVNFPARTIAFLNSDRFNGREFLPLNPTEFHQMTGRAGRRGMDHIGFAVIIPGKYMDVRLTAKLMTSPPTDVVSQIKINFSMALNLLLSHTPEQIEDLLRKSFATYVIARTAKKVEGGSSKNAHKHLWLNFLKHLDFLKETGYADKNGSLTDDGIWASQLRIDQPLLIAEGLRLRLFPKSDPALLSALVASFVSERETDDSLGKLFKTKTLLNHFILLKKGLEPFIKHMADRNFEVRPLFFRPVSAIYAWANGQPWEKVLAIAEMEEGDLAMLVLRTADNLRHLRTLKQVFPEVASTSATSIDLMMRYPVTIE